MKNFIIIIIFIAVVGLFGFSIIKKQATISPEPNTKANNLELNKQGNFWQVTMKIDGMWCVSCATGAEYALKDKVGVIDASVDYDSKTGKVVYDPSKISKDEIIQAVKPYVATITEDAPL